MSIDIIELLKNDPRINNKEEDISFNKTFNKRIYEANRMGVLSKCSLCGKDITGRANSHSIPQSILKNIKTDGHYCQITCAVADGLVFGPFGRMNRTGLNNTGTFHLLCKECENRTFINYENLTLLESVATQGSQLLTDTVLAEIMLKSALREKHKKELSKNLTTIVNEMLNEENKNWNTSTLADELNLCEYSHYIERCVKIINDELTNQFNVFYFDVLDHQSHYACQTLLAIQKTVTNKAINNVYNYDPNYNIALSQFVVFPLKEKTICLGYCLKEDEERLMPFIDYINDLSILPKRKLFQSTLFLYSEEIFTNEMSIKELIKDKISLNFIEMGIEGGWTTESKIKNNELITKPNLIAPNHFRKATFHL